MRNLPLPGQLLRLVQKASRDRRIGIDAPVAQKGPVAARILEVLQVNFLDQDGFAVMGRLGQDAAKGIGDKGSAPELEPDARGAVAAYVSMFVANAVDGSDVNAVGDGMGSLDGLPRVVLRRAEVLFFRRMPADGGGIEEQVGSAQGGDARRFRVPLVPTDERAHLSHGSIEGA